jgi:hypothetical protein
MKRFLNFNYATMKFLIFHKFCSFWSFGVYGPSSSMVDDYTAERERERALAVIAINVIKAGI